MIKRIILVLLILLSLVIIIGCDCTKDGYSEGYDGGYFHGWFDSQFIDCSLPEINQTMEVLVTLEGGGNKVEFITWKDMCNKLMVD